MIIITAQLIFIYFKTAPSYLSWEPSPSGCLHIAWSTGSPRSILQASYIFSHFLHMSLCSFALYIKILLLVHLPGHECITENHGFFPRCYVSVKHMNIIVFCWFMCHSLVQQFYFTLSSCSTCLSALATTPKIHHHPSSLTQLGYIWLLPHLVWQQFSQGQSGCYCSNSQTPFLGDIVKAPGPLSSPFFLNFTCREDLAHESSISLHLGSQGQLYKVTLRQEMLNVCLAF